MKKVTLKIRHHFDAAHRLEGYKGKCATTHGHRWHVSVFARGIVKPNGMLVDFTKIKEEINKLDHQDLNKILEFNPTAEHIAIYLLAKFEVAYPEINFKVRLYETPDASVEVTSDEW